MFAITCRSVQRGVGCSRTDVLQVGVFAASRKGVRVTSSWPNAQSRGPRPASAAVSHTLRA